MSSAQDKFRVLQACGQWQFEVGVIAWPHPHTPEIKWATFRTWKRPPTESRVEVAKAAALRNPRFFRTCTRCGELHNTGHMHDELICQSCAERHFGVIY